MVFPNLSVKLKILPLFMAVAFSGCTDKEPNTLFKLLPASKTNVKFSNTITESDSINILNQANLYNGGGVGIGDFNNDGLQDLYLAGNMVSNKLYLNKGSLEFNDITEVAGVDGAGRWCTGIAVIDINHDGWLDIYVSTSFRTDTLRRTNLLYINQGTNKNGIPIFKESAKVYGLADTGYSTQAAFFDYDKDGDLDAYLVTNELNDPKTPIRYRPKVADGTALNTDRLYRNNSNGTFTNVSKEAGILTEGWGHTVCVSDINLDGYPDIYISNDFISNDLLYINNGNGTFTDRLAEYFKHTSWNAMGTDIADINNDGLMDVISLEMLPEDNLRKKTMLSGNEYFNYFNSRKFGYEHQYVRNTFQLNQGNSPKGHPSFSEVGYMSGIYQTDWSWDPLIADFDNDGFRDLIITNGLPRDVTDLDYIVFNNGQGYTGGNTNSTLKMAELLPIVKIPNYAFKNSGGFLFDNLTIDWGITHPSFSNGAAYADLDNDGDLDLVINNINDNAFLYENTLNRADKPIREHYLSVNLIGNEKNKQGIGAKLQVYYDHNKQQIYEHQPSRGYLSSVDAKIHFGLGTITIIDSLRVQWPDGKIQLLTRIKTNQAISIHQSTAKEDHYSPKIIDPVFVSVANSYGIIFKHQEKDAIDYNIQPTLPHKLSQYGPGIAVGDIDQNGFDDFYIGGSAGYPGVFFMQDKKGSFSQATKRIAQQDHLEREETGVLLFDVEGDGDLDLYIACGSYEFSPNHLGNQDRLYINNGKGQFKLDDTALPRETANGSCVRAADFDQDGDLDLFIGGRSVSGAYPSAPKSYLLENRNGLFVDVTPLYFQQVLPGMVTDALWSDFDQDGKVDLVLTGEWMPITFLRNTGQGFAPVTESGIEKHVGWFNSLVAGDFDNDGDMDYVAGNLGLNSDYHATFDEPMTILAKDMDENGKMDPMVFCYMKAEDGTKKSFPMSTRDDMISQIISIRKKYPTYKDFGKVTMNDLWGTKDRENAIMIQATDMSSSYIENQGNSKFGIRPLPLHAQTAPVYGMVSKDIDGDGNLDLIMVGNDYGMEPLSGRHDAFPGLCLKGNGKGQFTSMSLASSGFFVNGDAKGLATIHTAKNESLLLATQNQDSLMVYRQKSNFIQGGSKWIKLNADDFSADLQYRKNKKRRVEFYYGSTYLSQSSRIMEVNKDVVKLVITNFKGVKREVPL